jgi:hypothetical protein
MWTCAISVDVLMSVKHRKWSRNGEDAERQSVVFKRFYFAIVFLFASPNFFITVVLQHMSSKNSDLGCNPGYEEIGNALAVFFTDILPIAIGFVINVYVYLAVRSTMSQKAYPQSVRKRRRRVMYHYVIVCIVSWTPTIAHYTLEVCGIQSAALEVTARGSLYLTGFLNFLVFGMQDPHLSRALAVTLYYLGCGACGGYYGADEDDTQGKATNLRIKEEQKSVMFTGHVEDNADIAKDKKDIYKYHKLSEEDKALLYQNRPDLNPRLRNSPASTKRKPKKRADSGVAQVSPLLMDDEEDDESGTDGSTSSPLDAAASQQHQQQVSSGIKSPGAPSSPVGSSSSSTLYSRTSPDTVVVGEGSLAEPLLAREVGDAESSIERQLRRSLSGDRYRRDRMSQRLSASTPAAAPDGGGGGDDDEGSVERKSSGGKLDINSDDIEAGLGGTPTTVSIDSRDSGGGVPPYINDGTQDGDSSSDEGDEEDDALDLPLGSTGAGTA